MEDLAQLAPFVGRNLLGLCIVAAAIVPAVDGFKRIVWMSRGRSSRGEMKGAGWKALLRWGLPLILGAILGGAVPQLWSEGVELRMGMLLGGIGGGPLGSTVLYPIVRKVLPEKVQGVLLMTSERREAASGRRREARAPDDVDVDGDSA